MRLGATDLSGYDHRCKAGNQGDLIKHPALVATLNGLAENHRGRFRYADAFAGRWDYDVSGSRQYDNGVGRFLASWRGGNPDLDHWTACVREDDSSRYPGSAKLADRVLRELGGYAIRAFEIDPDHASDLCRGLRESAVYRRTASAADWQNWVPDLLFLDPPGLFSPEHRDFPELEHLLELSEAVPNVLMWLPLMGTEAGLNVPSSTAASSLSNLRRCKQAGFRVVSVRWSESLGFCGCALLHRLNRGAAETRIESIAGCLVRTMGEQWRLLQF